MMARALESSGLYAALSSFASSILLYGFRISFGTLIGGTRSIGFFWTYSSAVSQEKNELKTYRLLARVDAASWKSFSIRVKYPMMSWVVILVNGMSIWSSILVRTDLYWSSVFCEHPQTCLAARK